MTGLTDAMYNGYCQYQNVTKCGGIRKDQRIVHLGKHYSYHPDCAPILLDEFPDKFGGVVDPERIEQVFG